MLKTLICHLNVSIVDFAGFIPKMGEYGVMPRTRFLKKKWDAPHWTHLDVKKPTWCPLVEVKSPHGKLVDADEMAEIYHAGSFNVVKVAKVMRAVIEAEEE